LNAQPATFSGAAAKALHAEIRLTKQACPVWTSAVAKMVAYGTVCAEKR
jgi:hypothetical protein